MWRLTRDRVLVLTTAVMTVVAGTTTVLYLTKSPDPPGPLTPVARTSGPPTHAPSSAPPTAKPGSVKAGSVKAAYAVRNKWKDGFNAEVTVTNLGSQPLLGWLVQLDLPKGVDVTSTWGATAQVQPGRLVMRSQAYNTYLEAGGAIRMGFEAKGAAAEPTTCTVNGSPC